MINKYFYLEGSYGHYSVRVKASEIIPFIPELIRSGRLRDIFSRNRWNDYKAQGHYSLRLYMTQWEIRNWLRSKKISSIGYGDNQDNSIIFENEQDYQAGNMDNSNPKNVVYL